MQQYRVKEALVEAVQLTESNTKEVTEWCKGKYISNKLDGGRVYKRMRNSEYGTFVFLDEWIIKHSDGFTKESDAKFRQTYEPVSAPSVPAELLNDLTDMFTQLCSYDDMGFVSYKYEQKYERLKAALSSQLSVQQETVQPQSEGGLQWVKMNVAPKDGTDILITLYDASGNYRGQNVAAWSVTDNENYDCPGHWKASSGKYGAFALYYVHDELSRWSFLPNPQHSPSTANTEEGAEPGYRDPNQQYTYYQLDFNLCPSINEEADYTICETLEEIVDQLRIVDSDLDDPTENASVTITGIGMTPTEFEEWKRDNEVPNHVAKQKTQKGSREQQIAFAEWLFKNRWFSFEDGKWCYTFESGTRVNEKTYNRLYKKASTELYELFLMESRSI